MSFWRLHYHLVWATKSREPLITPEIEQTLFALIVQRATEMGAHIHAINGWTDHVHLIISIPPQVAISDLVRHIKGGTSHRLNLRGSAVHFGWQRGYGVLMLGERQRPAAELYVRRQKEHHQSGTVNAWLERTEDVEEQPEPGSTSEEVLPATIEAAA